MIRINLGQVPERYIGYRARNLARFLVDREWRLSKGYKRALDTQLNNTCSFLGISFNVEGMKGQKTIEHFMPKSSMPQHTYDWDNFRLCEKRLNASFPDGWPDKAHRVLDPAADFWHNNWFYLDRATGYYACSTLVPPQHVDLVKSTCEFLNKHDFPQLRLGILERVKMGSIAENRLKSHYPGIHTALQIFPA